MEVDKSANRPEWHQGKIQITHGGTLRITEGDRVREFRVMKTAKGTRQAVDWKTSAAVVEALAKSGKRVAELSNLAARNEKINLDSPSVKPFIGEYSLTEIEATPFGQVRVASSLSPKYPETLIEEILTKIPLNPAELDLLRSALDNREFAALVCKYLNTRREAVAACLDKPQELEKLKAKLKDEQTAIGSYLQKNQNRNLYDIAKRIHEDTLDFVDVFIKTQAFIGTHPIPSATRKLLVQMLLTPSETPESYQNQMLDFLNAGESLQLVSIKQGLEGKSPLKQSEIEDAQSRFMGLGVQLYAATPAIFHNQDSSDEFHKLQLFIQERARISNTQAITDVFMGGLLTDQVGKKTTGPLVRYLVTMDGLKNTVNSHPLTEQYLIRQGFRESSVHNVWLQSSWIRPNETPLEDGSYGFTHGVLQVAYAVVGREIVQTELELDLTPLNLKTAQERRAVFGFINEYCAAVRNEATLKEAQLAAKKLTFLDSAKQEQLLLISARFQSESGLLLQRLMVMVDNPGVRAMPGVRIIKAYTGNKEADFSSIVETLNKLSDEPVASEYTSQLKKQLDTPEKMAGFKAFIDAIRMAESANQYIPNPESAHNTRWAEILKSIPLSSAKTCAALLEQLGSSPLIKPATILSLIKLFVMNPKLEPQFMDLLKEYQQRSGSLSTTFIGENPPSIALSKKLADFEEHIKKAKGVTPAEIKTATVVTHDHLYTITNAAESLRYELVADIGNSLHRKLDQNEIRALFKALDTPTKINRFYEFYRLTQLTHQINTINPSTKGYTPQRVKELYELQKGIPFASELYEASFGVAQTCEGLQQLLGKSKAIPPEQLTALVRLIRLEPRVHSLANQLFQDASFYLAHQYTQLAQDPNHVAEIPMEILQIQGQFGTLITSLSEEFKAVGGDPSQISDLLNHVIHQSLSSVETLKSAFKAYEQFNGAPLDEPSRRAIIANIDSPSKISLFAQLAAAANTALKDTANRHDPNSRAHGNVDRLHTQLLSELNSPLTEPFKTLFNHLPNMTVGAALTYQKLAAFIGPRFPISEEARTSLMALFAANPKTIEVFKELLDTISLASKEQQAKLATRSDFILSPPSFVLNEVGTFNQLLFETEIPEPQKGAVGILITTLLNRAFAIDKQILTDNTLLAAVPKEQIVSENLKGYRTSHAMLNLPTNSDLKPAERVLVQQGYVPISGVAGLWNKIEWLPSSQEAAAYFELHHRWPDVQAVIGFAVPGEEKCEVAVPLRVDIKLPEKPQSKTEDSVFSQPEANVRVPFRDFDAKENRLLFGFLGEILAKKSVPDLMTYIDKYANNHIPFTTSAERELLKEIAKQFYLESNNKIGRAMASLLSGKEAMEGVRRTAL
jgi:hypothetical protein